MNTKILNQAQAEAVYSAMCHLNNVGGTLAATMNEHAEGTFLKVWENTSEGVRVMECKAFTLLRNETHRNQSAFATAYGLQQG